MDYSFSGLGVITKMSIDDAIALLDKALATYEQKHLEQYANKEEDDTSLCVCIMLASTRDKLKAIKTSLAQIPNINK